MRITKARAVAIASLLVVGLGLAPSLAEALPAQPQPFGHECVVQTTTDVRLCATTNLDERVPSFDGAPLDVDVTLPTTGAGPWPTIIMAPPTMSSKSAYESKNAAGTVGVGPQYSNVWYAHHGYAVVTYSMRGTFDSCGTVESRSGYPACKNVEFEFGDQRYDARDAQYLLGTLVDQGIADPNALGMTGLSLGSIATLEVAFLKDRVRLTNGAYAPWTSPAGVPLHLSAAYSTASIGDVLDAAVPNGRFLTFDSATAGNDNEPIGVPKLSFTGTFALGTNPLTSYWDIPSRYGGLNLPLDAALAEVFPAPNKWTAAFADEIHTYHQAIGIPLTSAPAPILAQAGWADVATGGATQALRIANYARSVPNSNVSVQLLDWGHPLAQNNPADMLAGQAAGSAFFDHYLKGIPGGPAANSVLASTSTCPVSATSGGPFTAQGMQALSPGAVRFGSAAAQAVLTGGNPLIGLGLDWAVGSTGLTDACKTYPSGTFLGTAEYKQKVTKTFTMLGMPTMTFTVQTIGIGGQLNARLWDVAPDGSQTFVTRGTYALTNNQKGSVTWQMWGAGHTFQAGHTMRVEILAHDIPTQRPSLLSVLTKISNFSIEIPSHEPADGGQIVAPTFVGGW